MTREPDLPRLLQPMVERAVDLDGDAFRVDRERVLAAMTRARQSSAPSHFRTLGLAAAGFAVLLFGGVLWREHQASSVALLEVTVSQGRAELSGATQSQLNPEGATRIAAAGELQTAPDSRALVRMNDGLALELSGRTRVALGQLRAKSSELRLLGGAVRCTVPHRSAARAFQVVTPDATVVDLGTVFSVSLEGPQQRTLVSVEEGEVLVRSPAGETRVRAPHSWSSAVTAETVPPRTSPPAVPAPSPIDAAPSANTKSASPAPKSAQGAPATTLGVEAQLLRQGLAAERQGRAADAATALTELVTRYPHSPLVPDARAALARIQASPSR